MKKIILIALLFIGFNSYAQFDKGGIISLSGVSVFQLDTSARNIIHIIEDERIAGGGVAFNSYERFYVNYIVTNLKSTGVWYKCKAIYGMVGGNAASHKWNWKDMRNLDVAFRLSYNGTITHNKDGMQGDVILGTYANTFFNPFEKLTINDFSFLLSIGKRATNSQVNWDFGAVTGSNAGIRVTNNAEYTLLFGASGDLLISEKSTEKVLILVNKKETNKSIAIINGVGKLYTQNDILNLVNLNLDLLNQNVGDSHVNPSNAIIDCFSIGNSLTDTQAVQMSQIITFAQTMRANF